METVVAVGEKGLSFMVQRHEKYINPHQRKISILLGIFIAFLEAYFLIQGL
jgi:hypothetical protein